MMKAYVLPVMIATALSGCQTATMPYPSTTPATLEQTAAQTLLIMFDNNVDQVALNNVLQRYGAKVTHQYPSLNGMAVYLPVGTNISQAMQAIKAVSGVKNVEKDSVQIAQ